MGTKTWDDKKLRRLQWDFSPDAYERLKKLRKKTKAQTNAEVVRNALRLYEWYLELKESNVRIYVGKSGVPREVELLF